MSIFDAYAQADPYLGAVAGALPGAALPAPPPGTVPPYPYLPRNAQPQPTGNSAGGRPGSIGGSFVPGVSPNPPMPTPASPYASLAPAGNAANPSGGPPMPPVRPSSFPMDAAAPPLPPRRPSSFPMDARSPAAPPMSPQAYGWANNPPMGDHGGMSGTSYAPAPSYAPPPGSNLAQGSGQPGQGLTHFLSNLFGNKSASSGSTKQPLIPKLLNLFGGGFGGFGGGASSALSDGFGGGGGLLSGLF